MPVGERFLERVANLGRSAAMAHCYRTDQAMGQLPNRGLLTGAGHILTRKQ